MKTTKWIGRTAFGLLMAALLGGVGYVVYLAFVDEGARAEGRRIYLKERVRRENARAEVKAQAIATVLAHGKKASSETRQAANALIESKVAKEEFQKEEGRY